MHEYSIVQALIEQCEDFAKENNAQKVTRVEIKIGNMSGVEPMLLKTAYETFKEKSICEEAELDIEISGGDEMYLMRLEMEFY